MNEKHESRVLRIEPLENRSLLAGNLFAGEEIVLDLFADGAAFSEPQQNVEAIQTQEVRTVGIDNGRNVQQTGRPNPPNNDRGIIQNGLFNLDSRTQVALAPIQAQQTQPSPADQVASRPPISAVDAAITTSESTESVDGAMTSATDALPGISLEQTSESPLVSDIKTSQRQLTPFTADLSAASQETTDGLIELSPSNLDLALDDPLDQSHLPWQLDTGVLPHIRSVIEQASNHRAEITDAAIAAWFGGPGGMIAVDQVLLPANSFVTGLDWLDVQLESTVNLHRSLEMIASGSTPPLSDVALDAIMASLAEIADSQVQPINSIHPFEIPKLTYSAIAIVTAAAIAARRKHRHWERTVPFNTPSRWTSSTESNAESAETQRAAEREPRSIRSWMNQILSATSLRISASLRPLR